jgi:hypothetical protein
MLRPCLKKKKKERKKERKKKEKEKNDATCDRHYYCSLVFLAFFFYAHRTNASPPC